MENLFHSAAMKKLVRYLKNFNTATAVLALKAGGSADLKTTGTQLAFLDGVPTTIGAQTTIDLSDATYCPASAGGVETVAGNVIATGHYQWLMVACSASAYKVYNCGEDAAPVIPYYDEDYVVIGFLKIANATGSNFTVGTTALDTGSVTTTYIQVIGPTLPSDSATYEE